MRDSEIRVNQIRVNQGLGVGAQRTQRSLFAQPIVDTFRQGQTPILLLYTVQ